jgi:hypothetical protein
MKRIVISTAIPSLCYCAAVRCDYPPAAALAAGRMNICRDSRSPAFVFTDASLLDF